MRFRSLLLIAAVCLSAAVCCAQGRTGLTVVEGSTSVTFSATPTFDASKANVFRLTLTGNVTSSTLSNAMIGQDLKFEICQDGTGGRTFVAPTNVQGFLAISSTASSCTTQQFWFDGTNAQPLTATATVTSVNGVTFAASPSTHSVPVVTAANTTTWKVVPDCQDTTGNHLDYTQSTDTWSCGTSVKALTPNKQIFTASGTFTIPAGVTAVKLTVVGGGGGGGGATAAGNGSGGGSGGIGIKWLTGLTPGNTLTITVGASGTGVSAANGTAGGASSVASGTQTITTISANGGAIGLVGAGALAGSSVPAAAGTGGDINIGGNPGMYASGATVGGPGAASPYGGGGGSGNSGPGGAASGFGGGGGGAGSAGNAAGGAGSGGIVIFEWTN
jgi:hypothetical protein